MQRGSRGWSILVGVLIVLACLMTVLATLTVGAQQLLLNTDRWVAVIGPLAENTAVQDDVANAIADATVGAIDTRALVANALPSPAQALATGVLDAAVRTFIHDQSLRLVESPQFATLWINLNRTAHAAAVALLRGQTPPNVTVQNGEVRFDYLPLIAAAVQRVAQVLPEVVTSRLALPSPDSPPSLIRQGLSTALGSTLPEGFGQVTLIRSDKLAAAQQAVLWIDRLTWLFVILTIALIVAALVLSASRWWTALWLGVGTVIGIVVARLVLAWVEASILGALEAQNGRAAVAAAIDAVMSELATFVVVVLVIAAVVAAVAALALWRASGWTGLALGHRGQGAVGGPTTPV
jgi:hypothetical protein